ncbi:MAG: endonuclease domain-containing protein [Actinomycetota bacterium]
MYPAVYRLAGTPRTWRQDALAACLHFGEGTAVSFRSAAKLRGGDAFKRQMLEITVSRRRNRRGPRSITIHSEPGGIPPEDITTIEGIPVTKSVRTLLDLATVEPEEVVEHCLDEWLRRRLVSLSSLERWLKDPVKRRHRGAPVLQRLVDVRATVGVTESPLETEILKLLRCEGLPIPMLQYVVRDGDRFVGRVDMAYPEHRVAIEVDSFKHHDQRRSFDAERARGNDLQSLGWLMLRITSKHLEEGPDAVASWVRRALNG